MKLDIPITLNPSRLKHIELSFCKKCKKDLELGDKVIAKKRNINYGLYKGSSYYHVQCALDLGFNVKKEG